MEAKKTPFCVERGWSNMAPWPCHPCTEQPMWSGCRSRGQEPSSDGQGLSQD